MLLNIGTEITFHVHFSDKRLDKRLGLIIDRLHSNFGHSIPKSFGNRGQTKACYDFFKHKKVKEDIILKSERERVTESIVKDAPAVVLGIQDTSESDFTSNRVGKADDIGHLNDQWHKGYFLHTQILTDAQGIPLGLFSQSTRTRPLESLGKSKERKYDPFNSKESYRWLNHFNTLQDTFAEHKDTNIICVCDSEADIHELLQSKKHDHIDLLVRSKHDRQLHQCDDTLKSYIAKQPICGIRVFDIIDENTGKKRVVTTVNTQCHNGLQYHCSTSIKT